MKDFIQEIKIFDNVANYDKVIDYPDGVLLFISLNKKGKLSIKDEFDSSANSDLHKLTKKVIQEKYSKLSITEGQTLVCVLLCPEYRRINIEYTLERMIVVIGILEENNLKTINSEYYYDMPVTKKIESYTPKLRSKRRFMAFKDDKRIELRTERYQEYYEMYCFNTLDMWNDCRNQLYSKTNYPSSKFNQWVKHQRNDLFLAYNRICNASKQHFRKLDFSQEERQWTKHLQVSQYSDIISKLVNNEPYQDAIWQMIKPEKPEYFLPTIKKD